MKVIFGDNLSEFKNMTKMLIIGTEERGVGTTLDHEYELREIVCMLDLLKERSISAAVAMYSTHCQRNNTVFIQTKSQV